MMLLGSPQVQHREGGVHDMAGHVAHRAGAEVLPRAPAERVIRRVVRAHGRRADPQIPVQAIGNRRRVSRPGHPLRPDRTVGPAVHLADRADGPGGDPFLHQPQPLFRVALVAHLGDDLVLPGGLGQRTRLADRPRERLLHVHVLAKLHRRHRDDRVIVVGGGDHDRVDVLLRLEHLPEVLVHLRLRELLRNAVLHQLGLRGFAGVAVAERDDVVALGHVHQVRRAHAVGVADDRDVDGVARRLEAGAEHVARHDREAGGGGGGGRHELAA